MLVKSFVQKSVEEGEKELNKSMNRLMENTKLRISPPFAISCQASEVNLILEGKCLECEQKPQRELCDRLCETCVQNLR